MLIALSHFVSDVKLTFNIHSAARAYAYAAKMVAREAAIF